MIARLLLVVGVVALTAFVADHVVQTTPDAGAPLSPADIQRVIQQGAPALKQTCWGSDGGTADVRALVHMVITPSGKVQTVSATGSDANVNSCLELFIGRWVFPPSSGSTTVDVPFHFVRQ